MNLKQKISEHIFLHKDSKLHIKTSESGLHTNTYLNTDYIISNPSLVDEITDKFLAEIKKRGLKPDWVITYPPFGIVLAFELARKLKCKFGCIDTNSNNCYFDIKSKDKAILVGDDIYSGGKLSLSIKVLKDMGVLVQEPIYSIANFSGKNELKKLELFSLISSKAKLYKKENRALCKKGSKVVLARPNWKKLF